MKKILITLLFCVAAYFYSIYFTGLQANGSVSKTTEIKSISTAGNCTDQNFCSISKERDQTVPSVSLPGVKE